MNEKRFQRLRDKATRPVAIGAIIIAAGFGISKVFYRVPVEEETRARWETIQFCDGSSYSLGDLDDDAAVDVIIENRTPNQMSNRTLFITEKFRNSKYNCQNTEIMPDNVRVTATRAYVAKRVFTKEIQEALRRK